MLDLSLVDNKQVSRTLKRLNTMKGRLPEKFEELTILQDVEIIKFVSQFDPTHDRIYTKWLMTSLLRNQAVVAKELKLSETKSNTVSNLLAEFHGIKQRLPLEQRDIFRYNSIQELEKVLIENRATRFRASKKFMKLLDLHECLLETQVMAFEGFSVHKARCIEDVIVITGGDKAFDQSGDDLYRQLVAVGDVYVFNTHTGPLVGALPRETPERGVLYDCTGEHAVFESALAMHPKLNWESAPELMTLLIKIDPMLPFDLEMTEKEPYLIALKQFHFVLLEDREIPEGLYDEITSDPEVGPLIAEVLEVN